MGDQSQKLQANNTRSALYRHASALSPGHLSPLHYLTVLRCHISNGSSDLRGQVEWEEEVVLVVGGWGGVCVWGGGGHPSLTGFSRSLSGREMCIHTGVTFLNKC